MGNIDPCLLQFNRGCIDAHHTGWKTYSQRAMTRLRAENEALYRLLYSIMQRQGISKKYTGGVDQVHLALSLFLAGVWPVPEMDGTTVEQLSEQLGGTQDDMDDVVEDGHRYLMSCFPRVYRAFVGFIARQYPGNDDYFNDVLVLACIISAAIKRQISNGSIRYQLSALKGIKVL